MKRENVQQIRKLIRVISDNLPGEVNVNHQLVLNFLGRQFCPLFKEKYLQTEVFSYLGDGDKAIELLANIAENPDKSENNWVFKYDY